MMETNACTSKNSPKARSPYPSLLINIGVPPTNITLQTNSFHPCDDAKTR